MVNHRQSFTSLIWSYCLCGQFSSDKTMDHISDTQCTMTIVKDILQGEADSFGLF